MPSDVYTDVVGAERTWPPAYDFSIHKPCTGCGADVRHVCTNSVGIPKRFPCVVRTR